MSYLLKVNEISVRHTWLLWEMSEYFDFGGNFGEFNIHLTDKQSLNFQFKDSNVQKKNLGCSRGHNRKMLI